jgi:hypothetical protein
MEASWLAKDKDASLHERSIERKGGARSPIVG